MLVVVGQHKAPHNEKSLAHILLPFSTNLNCFCPKAKGNWPMLKKIEKTEKRKCPCIQGKVDFPEKQ